MHFDLIIEVHAQAPDLLRIKKSNAPKLAQVKSSRQFDLTVNDDKTIIFRPFRIKIPEKGKYFFHLPARVWEH